MALANFFKSESKCVIGVAVIDADADGGTDADADVDAPSRLGLLQKVDRAIARIRWRRFLLLWSGSGDEIHQLRFEPDLNLRHASQKLRQADMVGHASSHSYTKNKHF